MKIGHISHVYLPNIGGIENYVYRLSSFLQSRNEKVIIYTTDLASDSCHQKEANAVYCRTTFSIMRNPFSLEFIKILIKSEEDIYHIHGYEFFTSLLAVILLKNKPKILTQHGVEIDHHNLKLYVLNRLYHPFASYILKNVDTIIVLGENDRKILSNSFNISLTKIKIIPNGIEIDKFVSLEANNINFVERHELRKSSFKILFVSRLVETKNAHILISAFVKYIKEDAELIIIGQGESSYTSKLRNLADGRVHILGAVSFEELVAAYNTSDLFVFLGELSEGMPTTILEAMACGLPVITTHVGNINDVVAEGENGFFINIPIDEYELSKRIIHLIHSNNKCISEANRLKIANRYNWALIADKIFTIYIDALKEYTTI